MRGISASKSDLELRRGDTVVVVKGDLVNLMVRLDRLSTCHAATSDASLTEGLFVWLYSCHRAASRP